MTIYYEPHPISAARKAQLRAQGYKIIDARFAPKDWQAPDMPDEAAAPKKIKRGTKSGA